MSLPGATGVRPDPLQHLDDEECRGLLRSRHVGRLAYCGPFGPRIVPLTYAVVDDLLLFRTSLGSDTARDVPQRWVAFEVDNLNELRRAGWSVQVRGFVELLPLDAQRELDLPQMRQPWAEDERLLVLRLPFSSVTGRRVAAS